MTTSELDTLTDYMAKTNSTMFPAAEKLLYYNIAHGILNGQIISQQEDRNEVEATTDTVADQREYEFDQVEMSAGVFAPVHHINWLKINYGDGFVPARFTTEAALISQYGTDLENALSSWPQSDPIYWTKGNHAFVAPTPTDDTAGTDRLKTSVEPLPVDLDRAGNDKPQIVPKNFHYLYSVFASWQYHKNNSEDDLAKTREREWVSGQAQMLDTMYPRNRQEDLIAGPPDEDGDDL